MHVLCRCVNVGVAHVLCGGDFTLAYCVEQWLSLIIKVMVINHNCCI